MRRFHVIAARGAQGETHGHGGFTTTVMQRQVAALDVEGVLFCPLTDFFCRTHHALCQNVADPLSFSHLLDQSTYKFAITPFGCPAAQIFTLENAGLEAGEFEFRPEITTGLGFAEAAGQW